MDTELQADLMSRIEAHLDSGLDPMVDDVMRHPVDRYVDRGHARRERQQLFADYPIVVGHGSDVRSPGDFFVDDLSGRSLLIVRGDDGVLRGFHNVCAHRGSAVEPNACGNQRRFTCPYHAWSYDAAGRLRSVPNDEGFASVDRETHGLVAVPVEERHGLVWAVPGAAPDAVIDVATYLGALDHELAGFGMSDHVRERTDILREPFNWKLVVDGFLETYHIRFLHRNTIGPYIGSNFALYDDCGLHARMVGLRASFHEARGAPRDERELLPHVAIIYLVFPNTVLVWQGDHFEIWSVFPDGERADRMVARASLLAPTVPTTDAEQLHWDKNWDVLMNTVLNEDFVVARTMQRNFSSGARTHAVFGRQEATLQHYHRTLERELDNHGVAVGVSSRLEVPT
jgi:nitrite reductase/ring-hydroxylating ferredoxin subunit